MDDTGQPATLEYAGRQPGSLATPWVLRKAALRCGWIPLVAGVAVVVGYLATDSFVFLLLGLVTFICGTLSILAGLGCLGEFLFLEHRRARAAGRTTARLGAIPLLVLLVNFPAAAGALWLVDYVKSAVTFVVVNSTHAEIKRFTLTTPVGIFEFGPLPANGSRSEQCHFRQWADLHYVTDGGSGSASRTGVLHFGGDDALGGEDKMTIEIKDQTIEMSAG